MVNYVAIHNNVVKHLHMHDLVSTAHIYSVSTTKSQRLGRKKFSDVCSYRSSKKAKCNFVGMVN